MFKRIENYLVIRGCVSYSSRDIFFFKQKTAYEMRISDWSSDVCSSDLTMGISTSLDANGHVRVLSDPYQGTIFTKRSGTTITFFGVAPASSSTMRGRASAEIGRAHV